MVPIWKNPVALYYRTMYMNKGSQFAPFIAHELKKLTEVGIKKALAKRHIIPQPNCKPSFTKGKSLGMEKFASFFALYSVGIVVSLIILLIEVIFKALRPSSQLIQKEKDDLRLQMFQKELQKLVDIYGSGDVKSGWIIEE